MGDEARKPTRRDLLELGAATAGAAVLQPWAVHIPGPREKKRPRFTDACRDPAPANPADATVETRGTSQVIAAIESKRPNVVFIVLDTVRVNHLSCYGYRRDTTPNLDAFAAADTQYRTSSRRLRGPGRSMPPMFTARLPVSWIRLHRCLDERFATLAGQLTAHGYQTVGLSSNAMLSATPGMTRGFQSFWSPPNRMLKGAADHMHNRPLHGGWEGV